MTLHSTKELLGSKTKEISKPLVPRKITTQRETDRIAQYLVDTFQAPEYLPAFNKIAWRLEDDEIHRMAGSAKEVASNPRAYFIVCAKNEIQKRGL